MESQGRKVHARSYRKEALMTDTINTLQAWDTAIVDLIEETPEIDPKNLANFHQNMQMFMTRRAPSWETAQNRSA